MWQRFVSWVKSLGRAFKRSPAPLPVLNAEPNCPAPKDAVMFGVRSEVIAEVLDLERCWLVSIENEESLFWVDGSARKSGLDDSLFSGPNWSWYSLTESQLPVPLPHQWVDALGTYKSAISKRVTVHTEHRLNFGLEGDERGSSTGSLTEYRVLIDPPNGRALVQLGRRVWSGTIERSCLWLRAQ